jgi:hypothetical protein
VLIYNESRTTIIDSVEYAYYCEKYGAGKVLLIRLMWWYYVSVLFEFNQIDKKLTRLL